jgi:hypothetical protein
VDYREFIVHSRSPIVCHRYATFKEIKIKGIKIKLSEKIVRRCQNLRKYYRLRLF